MMARMDAGALIAKIALVKIELPGRINRRDW